MRIDIIDRDRDNGHFDVYIDGSREFAIRGTIGNLWIRYEGRGDPRKHKKHNFKTVDACLTYIFVKLLLNRI